MVTWIEAMKTMKTQNEVVSTLGRVETIALG